MSFPEPSAYCAEASQHVNELMAGTAVYARVWFLLEYNAPWQAKATVDNNLPPSVQQWMAAQTAAVPHSRWQFIKRDGEQTAVTFFVAILNNSNSRLYRFETNDYADLFRLDIPAVIRGDGRYAGSLTENPLILVCTNGRRDRCCARFGLGLYRELAEAAPGVVWQTTHLGGHRFAPTLVTFPGGVSYGRVTPTDIPELLSAQQDGRILLHLYRGQVNLPPPAQAAAYFWRQETGRLALADLQLAGVGQIAEEKWRVGLTGVPENKQIKIDITSRRVPIYASCGATHPKTIRCYFRADD